MSEVEVLHQSLLQRTQGVFSLSVAVTQAAATPRLPVVPDAIPAADEDALAIAVQAAASKYGAAPLIVVRCMRRRVPASSNGQELESKHVHSSSN